MAEGQGRTRSTTMPTTSSWTPKWRLWTSPGYFTSESNLKHRTPSDILGKDMEEEDSNPMHMTHLDLCPGYFDAVTSVGSDVFIFKNKFVWQMDANLFPIRGYPISQLFPGLTPPSPSSSTIEGEDYNKQPIVDAAYQRQTDGAVVLFSNHRYYTYRYNGSDFQLLTMHGGDHADFDATATAADDDDRRPQQQRTIWDFGLSANLSKIDAVFVWPKNKKTYIFTDESFWRYDDYLGRMDEGYPKSITRWHGIPFHIDAVMSLPGVYAGEQKTLFFKKNAYWLLDDHWVRPALGYPRLINSLFPDC